MTFIRATVFVLAIGFILALAAPVPAQRDKAKADAPTAVGKVAAYEADKSITIETKKRNAAAVRTEFAIVKDKTKIEGKVEVGTTVSVWADKDNPKQAAKIAAKPAAPTVRGKVAAYEADKSITVETKKRNAAAVRTEFAIVKDKTKIEGKVEVGTTVSVWADKNNPKQAAKISAAGAGRRPPAPSTEESGDVKKVLDAGARNFLAETPTPRQGATLISTYPWDRRPPIPMRP